MAKPPDRELDQQLGCGDVVGVQEDAAAPIFIFIDSRSGGPAEPMTLSEDPSYSTRSTPKGLIGG